MMIRFKRITLTDFGPFFGEQTIVFPDHDGVVVIYGQNGRGKTSFLNAVRWALTGVVLDRGGRARPPERLVNRDRLEADPSATCRVVIELDVAGTDYVLTRLTARAGERTSVELLLKRAGQSLNREQAESELARILPPETQQFFLFDGELLNQFESLLRDDEGAGAKLKASIERMLGIPVVANAAADCLHVAEEATAKLAEAAKHDKDVHSIGVQLSQAQELHKQAREAERLEGDRAAELESEREAINGDLSNRDRSRATMVLLGEKRNLLKVADGELVAETATLQESLRDAWKAVLAGRLKAELVRAREELDTLIGKRNRAAFAAELKEALSEDAEHCPACATGPLGEEHLDHLNRTLRDADDLEQLDEELSAGRGRVAVLSRYTDTGPGILVKAAEAAVRSRRVEIRDLKQEIADLESDLGDVEEKDLQELVRRQREVTLALKEAQSGQNAKREEAERQRTNVEGLKKKLSKFSERNIDPTVRAENDLGQQLGELFQRGIEEYRDRLLRGVEEAATSLFLKMRSEEDFKGLRINDRYGLAIVDGEGSEVGDRSAGYEHLVALSLIGGLQACSTIAGPVLMDSPFGRLDETHVEQVTSSLSLLSPQVMLLVHEREVDPDEAGNLLGARLLAEYELVRRSSTHTDLRPRRAP